MRLEVGRVARPRGLRGEVFVDLVTNRLERLRPGSVLYAGERKLVVFTGSVLSGGLDARRATVRFEGVEDRHAAERLRGSVLTGDPLGPGEQGEDELWAHRVIGSEIVDVAGQRRGTVISVQANPAHDLLVTSEGHLVPVVFVISADEARVVIDPPPGLFEAQA